MPRHFARGISPFSKPEVADTVAWLKDECGLDDSGAEQAIEYIVAGPRRAGRGAHADTPSSPNASSMKAAACSWSSTRLSAGASTKPGDWRCASVSAVGFNFELQAAATDNGLNIALAEQHSFPLADVFNFLQPRRCSEILEQAALDSPIFATRWRWDANRSLALLRFQNGKKVPPQIQRMRSDDLLASVFPDVAACQENIEGDIQIPDHPLVGEVMKDVLTEAMDIEGLKALLAGIARRTRFAASRWIRRCLRSFRTKS